MHGRELLKIMIIIFSIEIICPKRAGPIKQGNSDVYKL